MRKEWHFHLKKWDIKTHWLCLRLEFQDAPRPPYKGGPLSSPMLKTWIHPTMLDFKKGYNLCNIRNITFSKPSSAYHQYSVTLNFKHLCSLKNFCEEIKVILRFNTLLSRNQQFEANFPHLFKKERLRDWALNACDVNPVSYQDTGLTSQATWPSSP